MLQQIIDILDERRTWIIIFLIAIVLTNMHLVHKNIDGLVIADLIGQIIGFFIVTYIYFKIISRYLRKQK